MSVVQAGALGEESRDSDRQPTKSNWFSSVSIVVVSWLSIINPFRIHHNQQPQPQDEQSLITSTDSHSTRLRQPQKEEQLVSTNSAPQEPHPAMTIEPLEEKAQQIEEKDELITATRSIPSYHTYIDYYQFQGTDGHYDRSRGSTDPLLGVVNPSTRSPSVGFPSPTLHDSPVESLQIQGTTDPLKAVVNPSTGSASDSSSTSAIDETRRASNEQQEGEDEEEEHDHPIIRIIDEQELGKHIFVLAIPLMIGLMANKADSISVCMLLVLLGLSFGFAAILIGILLRKTYPKASVVILVTGIGLMLFAIFVFMGCFVPPRQIWVRGVLGVCWLSTLFPLSLVILRMAFPGKKKIADLEKANNQGT
ncbi:hypothetical protein O6P43_032845 [Quillaja saponaria]|uniref:Uncharacterized protein n=1 Tax=Quillaja saponaria TaxID=32244 RepID=A0AAD7KPB9_QUISA|nr:hypothetical protein O6P43_032845 [Quillaja saponaria]